MDSVTDPSVHTIVVMKSAQIGWTEIINNIVGYFIDQDPCPIMVIQPTEHLAETWSKDRLAPMIRDTACLTKKVRDSKSRDSGNTILHKNFPGGHLTAIGANAPSNLASRPIRIVLPDEVDRYPASAGAEGDPINLAQKRTRTFFNRKLMMGSTPTVKEASRIELAFEDSDQRRYFVPCPDCNEFQTLKWAQVQWLKNEPDKAYYVCEHCGSCIQESSKHWMVRQGEWRATKPFSGTAGFHIWEGYSPWSTWGELAVDFLKAKRNTETLKTFVNTSLGETWEEAGETVDPDSLFYRREQYPAPFHKQLSFLPQPLMSRKTA
jgi:phage terminase large subunit GpA-like protein